ncbi:MAG: HD-GYP domain-containing protein [Butyrivibrio sp.]
MKLEYKDYERILNIGIGLCTERDRNRLFESILESGMKITHCDGGTLYIYEDNKLVFKIMKTVSMGINRGADGKPVEDMPPVPMEEKNVCAYTAIHREAVNIPDVYNSERFDFSGPRRYDMLTGYHTQSQLVVPIENNENELLGVLQLINAMDEDGNVIPFDEEYNIIIRSLSSMAAIELTNISYMQELKKLMYSFVEAFATAIDERIPYNGSHTRRVAEFAGILADYITKKHEAGECEEFFDEDRKEKLLLAALLHDIGKMIIPLKVINRATRLDKDMERVDRRFELLASYYEVDMLRGRISQSEYMDKISELKDDLEFIHKVDSIGFLDDEKLMRVKEIGAKVHVKEDGTVTSYLHDKEISYLSVRKGTLNDDDRRMVESHVVMTRKILSKVHFNKNYNMVPKWAADHHEFLDGTGYPDHLRGDEIDLETRILTVSDIYEALTATDRPYKKGMPMDKAVAILRSMAEEGKVEMRLVNWLVEAIQEGKNDEE